MTSSALTFRGPVNGLNEATSGAVLPRMHVGRRVVDRASNLLVPVAYMLRRALARRCLGNPTLVAPFYRSGGLNEPIAAILKECCPHDAQRWDVALKPLDDARIRTAGDRLRLSPEGQRKVTAAGLPATVVSTLDVALRVGLLVPSFKFRVACEFIVAKGYNDYTTSAVADEARTLLQIAESVDNNWVVLTRGEDCGYL